MEIVEYEVATAVRPAGRKTGGGGARLVVSRAASTRPTATAAVTGIAQRSL
jgi:hypothetical protein